MLPQPPRLQFATQSAVLLAFGAVIAFSAPLHDTVFSQVTFALAVIVTALGEIAVQVIAADSRTLSKLTLFNALLALVVAIVTASTLDSFTSLTLTVTIWAALSAVALVFTSWNIEGSKQARETKRVGLLLGALALLLLIVPSTPSSVIGLFGGYCFVVGIFLAIAAVDLGNANTSKERQ